MVHWDDPEGWYREGGGRGVQDEEHVYAHGRFMLMYGKNNTIWQQIWKTQQWPQDWKMSVFISIPKKGNAKECSNYRTIALISHASQVMLKILQARL